jgi:hypothetical protein
MYINIVSVYIDDINIIGKRHDINKARHHLTEFEMEDLDETKLCSGLQLEYFYLGCVYSKGAIHRQILVVYLIPMTANPKQTLYS